MFYFLANQLIIYREMQEVNKMMSLNDYKENKIKEIDIRNKELGARTNEILGEIEQDAIRRENGSKGKLNTMDYLDNMDELIGIYHEMKAINEKLKGK